MLLVCLLCYIVFVPQIMVGQARSSISRTEYIFVFCSRASLHRSADLNPLIAVGSAFIPGGFCLHYLLAVELCCRKSVNTVSKNQGVPWIGYNARQRATRLNKSCSSQGYRPCVDECISTGDSRCRGLNCRLVGRHVVGWVSWPWIRKEQWVRLIKRWRRAAEARL